MGTQGSRRGRYAFLAGAAVALAFAAAAIAATGAYHEDDRIGYKIRVPRDWTLVPMSADEKWIVAKFLSERAFTYTDPNDHWTSDHKPVMTVIAFIDEVVKKRGVDAKTTEEGDLFVEINNPYKDYQDYLRKTYSGGGWYVSAEAHDTIDGVNVTQYEIKVEKLTQNGPKHIVTWVYELPDVKVAVEFEVLEGAWPKLQADVLACLRSFRKIQRTHGGLTPAITGDPVKIVDESKLTPEKRKEHRQEVEERTHKKLAASVPSDWTTKEMGRFLVLNHADDKYAKQVVAHAEAVWKWLDDEFDFVGAGEYVPRPVIRICKDQDEENAFWSGTSWGLNLEIVTHKDAQNGAMSYEFERVNSRLLDIWWSYRDADLYSAMPRWLKRGLEQVLGTARAKGSTLELKPDDWERDGLRESVRTDGLTPPKELVLLGQEKFYENPNRVKQSAAFIRLLLSSRSKRTKDFLKTYLVNLRAVLDEELAAEKATKPETEKPPATEEEEEERFKNRSKAFEEKEKHFLEAVFERTFKDWSDKDWKRLADEYEKSI